MYKNLNFYAAYYNETFMRKEFFHLPSTLKRLDKYWYRTEISKQFY